MISVITCSKQPDQALALKENRASTIGVPFEVIIVDNTSGFHPNDLDICMQAQTLGYTNNIINDVLLTCYSKGFHNAAMVDQYVQNQNIRHETTG